MGLNGERDVLREIKIFIWRDRVSEWHPNDFPLSTRSARRHNGRAVLPAPTLASLSHTQVHARSQLQSPAFLHQQQRQQQPFIRTKLLRRERWREGVGAGSSSFSLSLSLSFSPPLKCRHFDMEIGSYKKRKKKNPLEFTLACIETICAM